MIRSRPGLVPGADLLADVAAEHPVAHSGTQLGRDWAAVLDREVRDAAGGVELTRADDRLRRAGVEARAAGAAVLVYERIGWQLGRGDDRTQHKVRAVAPGQETRILADEPEAGPDSGRPVHERPRIDKDAAARPGDGEAKNAQ